MSNVLAVIVCLVLVMVLLFGVIFAIDIFFAQKPIDVNLIQEKYNNYFNIIQKYSDYAECQIEDQTATSGIYYFYTFAKKDDVTYTVSFVYQSTGKETLEIDISKEDYGQLSIDDFSLFYTIVQEFSKMDYEINSLEKDIEQLLSAKTGGIRIGRNEYIGFLGDSNTLEFRSLLK